MTWKAVSLAMPAEELVFRPVLRLAWQKNPSTLKICETLAWNSIFYEFFSVHKHLTIIT
jgi:hypothetical protein